MCTYFHALTLIIIVKDLVSVVQDGLDHADLPTGIRNRSVTAGAHQGRAKNDGQILRAHPVGGRVLDHLMKMERQGPQGGVVRIREAVDDCVEGVTADDIIFLFCWNLLGR